MSETNFKPRRGRPTAAQTAAIEKTILTTAKDMFLEQGYDAVAMEVIAAKAGVAKGTLYSRYPSKEALFEAIVKFCVNEWSDQASKADAKLNGPLLDVLKYHARTIARSQLNPEIQAFQRLLMQNAERFPEIALIMHDVGYLYIVDVIVQSIELAAQESGEIYKNPRRVAEHIVAVIFGWYLQESSYRNITLFEIEKFAEEAVELLFAAKDKW